jgi:hypothetical protein
MTGLSESTGSHFNFPFPGHWQEIGKKKLAFSALPRATFMILGAVLDRRVNCPCSFNFRFNIRAATAFLVD